MSETTKGICPNCEQVVSGPCTGEGCPLTPTPPHAAPEHGQAVDELVEAWKRELIYDLGGDQMRPMVEVDENRLVALLTTAARRALAASPSGGGEEGRFVDGVPTWVCHCGHHIALGMGCATCGIQSSYRTGVVAPVPPVRESSQAGGDVRQPLVDAISTASWDARCSLGRALIGRDPSGYASDVVPFAEAVADALLATPPSAGEREPDAWALTYCGELMRDAVFVVEREAVDELERRNAQTPQYAHNRGIRTLYRAPVAPAVTEAMVEAAMKADGFDYSAAGEMLVFDTREFYRRILTAALSASRPATTEGR